MADQQDKDSQGTAPANDEGGTAGTGEREVAKSGESSGGGQGDDLANRLGGDNPAGTGASGAGAATGDASAGRSGETNQTNVGAGGPDAGSPGGMGGVRGGFDTGGRPPGGVSPLQAEEELKS
jgi:hypothetical protein